MKELAPLSQKSLKRMEGGLKILNFVHLCRAFKIKWLKKCLKLLQSLWHFIPHKIFKNLRGLNFLMGCNYTVSKLLVKLCQQVMFIRYVNVLLTMLRISLKWTVRKIFPSSRSSCPPTRLTQTIDCTDKIKIKKWKQEQNLMIKC